jgi:hypothetical protein
MKLSSIRRLCFSLGAIPLLVATGCGAGAREAAPAQTPASESYGAPAEESNAAKEAPRAPTDDRSAPGAPAPAQAPAAGSAFPGSTKGEARPAEADDIDALSKRLEGALTLSVPDCTTAWSLRDRICDLADRICDMAGRSAERDVVERCNDGRTRCERATSRVRESCGR